MAAYFDTASSQNAHTLLASFDAAIAKGNSQGGIATWKKVNGYYTHTSTQWGGLAYLQAIVSGARLTFNIIAPSNGRVSVIAYGYYHGHIIETMLNHFDKMFVTGAATALPTPGDRP